MPSARRWVIGGVGVLLPERVLEAAAARATDIGHPFERMDLASVERYAGPTGLLAPNRIAAAVDSPAAPELLHP